MIRAYTMRLKVTRKQDEALQHVLAQLCELYNMALEQRRNVWKSHRLSFSFYDQCKQLTELRGGVEEYGQGSMMIQRDPLRRVGLAFDAFFRRVKSGDTPGYPRFRSRERYHSFSVGKGHFSFNNKAVSIPKLGTVKIKTRCRVKGAPLQLHVKRCGSKWQVQIVCDLGDAPARVPINNAVGIDLGLTSLATLSDGTEIKNPRWTRQEEGRLAAANRDLSTKMRGSNNRNRSRERLRRAHQRIAGKRSAYLAFTAKSILSRYDMVAHEDLKIRNMLRSNMAKSIMDAAWAQLIFRLNCEAEKAGKWVIPVNPRNTTINCSECGGQVPKKLSERQHDCPKCGLSLGRDHNAALNILRLGESHALKGRMR